MSPCNSTMSCGGCSALRGFNPDLEKIKKKIVYYDELLLIDINNFFVAP